MNKINIAEVSKYLNFFYSQTQTFCLLTKDSKSALKGFGTIHATVDEILELITTPLDEFTLHMCLNLTNDKGRRTENIIGTQCFCVDIDKPITPGRLNDIILEFTPHMVVQSDPSGKYHMYWRAEVPLERWELVQLGLAFQLGGDLGMRTRARTIRVPGVERVLKTGEEFVPLIFRYLECEAIQNWDIDEYFGSEIWEWAKSGHAHLQELSRERTKSFKAHVKDPTAPVALPKNLASLGRNETLYFMCQKFMREKSTVWEEVLGFAIGVNKNFPNPLSKGEFYKTLNSVFKRN